MFDSESAFRAAGSAAVAVLDHCATITDVSAEPWTFDRGAVSSDGRTRAWAEFSHVAIADAFLRDTLAVIAAPDKAGGWKLAHAVTLGRM